MARYDRRAIAARLRVLLQRNVVEVPAIATRLGVDEGLVHLSIDERTPLPAMEVLVAVVRHMAVDPMWLLTGEYSSRTHVAALAAARAAHGDEAVRLLFVDLTGDETLSFSDTPTGGTPTMSGD